MVNIKIQIYNKPCSVCGKIIKKDIYGQGECPYCGWYNCFLNDEHQDSVIFPNLVSQNKARIIFKEGKIFRPDLNDFLDMTYCYSETEFWYNGINFNLFKSNDNVIKFCWSPENIYYFKNKEDFIANAKIYNEYVRDIWDKVENPKYM